MKTKQNKTALLRFLVIVVGGILGSAIVQAQVYDLSWNTVDGGGGTSIGGNYSISGTFGQPDAGEVLSSGAFELTGGFWPIANTCFCPGDLNGDGRRDGRDVQGFVWCVTTGGACTCADIDHVGGLTAGDVAAFVNTLLAATACP